MSRLRLYRPTDKLDQPLIDEPVVDADDGDEPPTRSATASPFNDRRMRDCDSDPAFQTFLLLLATASLIAAAMWWSAAQVVPA